MKKYIRFGNIPKNEKSINFLKMTLDQVADFSDIEKIAGYDAALEVVPAEAFENGVSVFETDGNGDPVLNNIELIKDFCERLSYTAFVVTGKEVGKGQGGEPLITGIEILNDYKADPQTIINEMKKRFKNYIFNKSETLTTDGKMHSFFDSKTGKIYYTFNGWTFSDPTDNFKG